jgi:hypothetical protein
VSIQQVLWVARWGTQSALVWATSAEVAELRVRRRAFGRDESVQQIMRKPVRVAGPVAVREATPADLEEFELAGGRVPA